jgi:prophage regulatory protein
MMPHWPRVLGEELAASYVGLSASSTRALRKAGDFPQPIQLTPGRVGWLREDLDAWVDKRAGRGGEKW